MNTYAADFHVHIGQALGKPVKITASKSLTLENVLYHALHVKGLQVITVIDGVCDHVLTEVKAAVACNLLQPVKHGGWLYDGKLLVLLGSEVELFNRERGGAAHFGCWFGTEDSLVDFQAWLKTVQTNTSLSSQMARTTPDMLVRETKMRNGLFVVHHAFTPFRGVLGACVNRLADYFDDPTLIDAIELGLSADSDMADRISELSRYTFLSNSDAHSLRTVAREFNLLQMTDLSMSEVAMALARQNGRRVSMNCGLHPAHGKYYRTRCRRCDEMVTSAHQVCSCLHDKQHIYGVLDRVIDISNYDTPQHPTHRPPYRHRVPLIDIPGVGSKIYEKLLSYYGTELNAESCINERDVQRIVGARLAQSISKAYQSEVDWVEGGGGRYGKLRV